MAGVADVRRRPPRGHRPRARRAKVQPVDLPRVLPPIDAVYVKNRMRRALGLEPH